MAIPKLEDCKLGMRASGWNCIVVPEPIEEKTAGGIFIPDMVKSKEEIVQQRARIVSIGPAAFDQADYKGQQPKVGDACLIAKLAGFATNLADGKLARVIQDKDVAVILEEDA